MIIVGGYHGIRLYEREAQPHDLCGIDIAKLNHFAPAISSDGVILMEPFKFTNDGDGFSLLESNLTSICDDKDNIIIGLESTVHCNALGHCAGKLVRIIWKMMTDNVEFNLD